MGEIRAVAIVDMLDEETGKSEMIQCLGAFDSFITAYGETMVYLTEMAANYEDACKGDECTLSPLRDLEGETGFTILLKNKAGQTLHEAYILHAADNSDPKTESGGDGDGSS